MLKNNDTPGNSAGDPFFELLSDVFNGQVTSK